MYHLCTNTSQLLLVFVQSRVISANMQACFGRSVSPPGILFLETFSYSHSIHKCINVCLTFAVILKCKESQSQTTKLTFTVHVPLSLLGKTLRYSIMETAAAGTSENVGYFCQVSLWEKEAKFMLGDKLSVYLSFSCSARTRKTGGETFYLSRFLWKKDPRGCLDK